MSPPTYPCGVRIPPNTNNVTAESSPAATPMASPLPAVSFHQMTNPPTGGYFITLLMWLSLGIGCVLVIFKVHRFIPRCFRRHSALITQPIPDPPGICTSSLKQQSPVKLSICVIQAGSCFPKCLTPSEARDERCVPTHYSTKGLSQK